MQEQGRNIQVGVQAFILQNNCLLMGIRKSSFANGMYSVPGGKLEFGESFEDAITREVAEETGLTVESFEIFGVENNLFPKNVHFVQIGFYVICKEGLVKNLEPEKCEGWNFFDINSLPNNISPNTINFLKQFLEMLSSGNKFT